MKKFRLIVLVIIGIICFSALTYADIPRVINYQGKFTDKSDNPLSGNYLVTFRFYDVASGGTQAWEEAHILALDNGIFSVLLGSINPLEISFNKDLWLGIEVASDGEMVPRIKLASSAYAMNAQAIDMLDSSQIVRNDVDAVMSGALTLKKDLILKGDALGPSRIVLTDTLGREYYLWVDNAGNPRLKQGSPASDKDGAVIIKEGGRGVSNRFLQSVTLLLLLIVVLIFGLILYSIKKR
ncbi:hypothetical protein ACFL28_03590 [Candidatus Omnitrophota bacterium]